MTTATQTRSMRIAERTIPIVLPNRRDPRLHIAAVIVTIHGVGITALGFEVSIPQILVSIVVAGLIDVGATFARTGELVWPASGMLTGSGVALILRHVGTDSGEYWTWEGWYWFAGVAGLSVLTKYVIRWRGDHVFNPSNLGLVLAFLVVGSTVIEPLDFWWAPLDLWMVVGYGLIIGGGITITRRLRLLEMAVVFWVVLVAGLGILAASGHCMIATWSPTPVCEARFFTTLATSPEVLVFLFFMITDPKTIPTGRAARVAFAAGLAILATMLIAPQTLEYGAKVGLLASLVLLSPLRWVFDRALTGSEEASGVREIAARLTGNDRSTVIVFAKGMAIGSVFVLVALGIVVAGAPTRLPAAATGTVATPLSVQIDESALPMVSVDNSLGRLVVGIEATTAQDIAVMLAENLELEAEAIRTMDATLLTSADAGDRLIEMQARVDDAITDGVRAVHRYDFDSLRLRLAEQPEGQASAAVAFDATGTVTTINHDTEGAEVDRSARPIETTFTLRQVGERWLIVGVEH